MPIEYGEMNRCFDSVETYTNKFGAAPTYSDGVLVNIGDTIEIASTRDEYTIGTLGRVAGFYNNGTLYIGMEFETHQPSNNNLFGILSESRGNWLRTDRIKFVNAGKLGETEDEEALIARILEEAKTEPKAALIDGKIFTLILQPRAKSDEFMSALMRSVSARISKVRADANAKVAAAEQETKKTFAMPILSLEDIRGGMRLYKEAGASVIHYVVPLHYAPKFIGDEYTKAPTKQISAEHMAKLEQDVLLDVQVRQTGTVYETGTKKLDLTPFYHYHGVGHDCLGQIKTPIVKTTTDIWDLRDTYQKTLEIVNATGAYSSDPRDMPSISTLVRDARVKITAGWEIKQEVTLGVLCIGASVKIIGAQDGATALIGLIGKIVAEHDTFWSVEFLDGVYARHLHTCNGRVPSNRGWDFAPDKLQVMPVGTRRTRVATEIETVETIATDSFSYATPEDEQFAKFGTPATSPINLELICARCGRRQGEHHGDERVSLCEDDRSDGTWVSSPHVREARTFPSVEAETVAKFGVTNLSGNLHIVCNRCGIVLGSHYGDEGVGFNVCPDERDAGRLDNRDIRVPRAWVHEPALAVTA